jgi:hypothetical protein
MYIPYEARGVSGGCQLPCVRLPWPAVCSCLGLVLGPMSGRHPRQPGPLRAHTSPTIAEHWQSQLGARKIVRSRKRLARSSNLEIDTWHSIHSRLPRGNPPGHLDGLERDSSAFRVAGGSPVIIRPYAAPRINRHITPVAGRPWDSCYHAHHNTGTRLVRPFKTPASHLHARSRCSCLF